MEGLSRMLDQIKDRAEEALEHYAKKEHWEPQDVKCAKDTAELYDFIQNIQMNNGIWENMKRTGDYSFGRYPNVSYGRDSRGRYTSHGDMYNDDRQHGYASYGDRYMDGRSMHSIKDQAIQKLEALMDTAQSDYEREEIHKMIKTIEKQER